MNEAQEKSQTVLLTGGTSGVGFECAKALSQLKKYDVIITGRDTKRGEEIATNLGISFLPLDLSSLSGIREFVENLKHTIQYPLRTVICNAGIQFTNNTTMSQDGYEMTFAVNHLGHFLLVNLLLPEILQRPARIVVVSSGTHDPEQETGIEPPRFVTAEKVSKGEFEGPKVLSGMKAGHCAYSTSKLCNNLFAFELNRKLKEIGIDDIYVNAFDPGLTPGTGLARHSGWIISFLFRYCPVRFLQMMWSNVHYVHESGKSLAILATDSHYDKLYGFYWEHDDLTPFTAEVSDHSHSRELADDLWDFSLQATNIDDLKQRIA